MIPIQEAIDTGAWLRAEHRNDKEILFQIKIKNFTKVSLLDIDEPDNIIDPTINQETCIWLLSLEIINLHKKQVHFEDIKKKLILIDEDGFEFNFLEDPHLEFLSKFAETSGVKNLYGRDLPPKIKRSGAILFELPEIFEHISLSIRNGSIREA